METGRPPILDEVKKREICAILTVGCTRAVAAQYVGCCTKTIRNTAQRDSEFALDLQRAETSDEIAHLANINRAAKEGRYWRAAAWALERKYPNRYAQRLPHTFTIDQVAQILAQFADVIVEEVSDAESRDGIMNRLSDLTAGLQAAAESGDEA